MKNLKLAALILLVVQFEFSFGQEIKINSKIQDNNELLMDSNVPLVVINGIELENYYAILSKITANDIEKMNVIKNNLAINEYGKKAKNGVIVIHLKNKNINTLKQLNQEYNLDNNKTKITISGTILDCENLPLPGAKITDLYTRESYYSDLDGNFSVNVTIDNVLEFTYPEMESKQITAKENSKINIQLKKLLNSAKIGEILIKKPVIYLYPTQKTDITIDLDFKGELLTTFPKYDKNWDVTAYPDGQIFDKKSNRFYSSLFWDGTQNFSKEHYNYQSGFVVSKNDLTSFLIEKLEYIGLNTVETNEFVQYWLPILEQNETNFIHFYVNADYDVISKNNVSPKPDTSIRLFMEFYGVYKTIEIPKQNLSKTERKGFTLVEWGGSDVSKVIKELNILKL